MISALIDLLQNYYNSGDLGQVELLSRTLLSAIPDDIVGLHFLAFAYLKGGRTQEARRLLRRLRTRIFVRKRARSDARQRSAYPAAIASLMEATEHNPEFAQTWYDLGTQYERLGYRVEAASAYRNAIKAREDFVAAREALGRVNDLLPVAQAR